MQSSFKSVLLPGQRLHVYDLPKGRKLNDILERFVTEGKTYHGNSWLNRSSYTITADAVTLCSCLWHLLPEKSLSLQEANKSQEYSDSCIFNNNYPSVGIGTGVSVLPKKKKTREKPHQNGYDALSLVQFL